MPPRGWRKPAQPELPPPTQDPYPQHARMYPFFQENWAIREFWHFLAERGLTDMTFDQVEDALLAFRGVDSLAYEAEAAEMRSEYRWLWEQFEMPRLRMVAEQTKPAVARVVAAALPDKTPDDGLEFLLNRIRAGAGGNDDQS